MNTKFNNNNLKVIITGVIATILIITFSQGIASSFSCSSNVCSGSDTVAFSDATNLFHALINAADKFTIKEKTIGVVQIMVKIIDKFMVTESAILKSFIQTTITSFITQTITQIAQNCAGSSCYTNPNATGTELIVEFVIFPAVFIFGTIFGFMYMGIRAFGVAVLIMTFLTLGLAYIGIIPSYFTLLTIIMVGAALTKLLTGLFGGSSE